MAYTRARYVHTCDGCLRSKRSMCPLREVHMNLGQAIARGSVTAIEQVNRSSLTLQEARRRGLVTVRLHRAEFVRQGADLEADLAPSMAVADRIVDAIKQAGRRLTSRELKCAVGISHHGSFDFQIKKLIGRGSITRSG